MPACDHEVVTWQGHPFRWCQKCGAVQMQDLPGPSFARRSWDEIPWEYPSTNTAPSELTTTPLWCVTTERKRFMLGPVTSEEAAEELRVACQYRTSGGLPDSDTQIQRCRQLRPSELLRFDADELIESAEEHLDDDGRPDGVFALWDEDYITLKAGAHEALKKWMDEWVIVDAFALESEATKTS